MAHDFSRSGPLRALPWFLALTVLGIVVVVYALLSEYGWFVVVAAVLLATFLGAVAGITLRDTHDRVVSVGHSLGEAARHLGHKLWY